MEPRCSTNLEARCSRDKTGEGDTKGGNVRNRERGVAYLLSARLLKIELLVSRSPTINRGTKVSSRDTMDRIERKKKKIRKRGRFFEATTRRDEDYSYFCPSLIFIISFAPFLKFRRTSFSIFHYYLKLLLNFLFLSKPIVETKFSCLSP